MAPAWFTRSLATIARNYLKRKIGFVGLLNQSVCTSTLSYQGGAENIETPHRRPASCSYVGYFAGHRLKSTKAACQFDQLYSSDDGTKNQVLDFPGGKVAYTTEMRFIAGSNEDRVPCYRLLDDNGNLIGGSNFKQVSEEVAVKIYTNMTTFQVMDAIFYEAQRQGRISFYLTTAGEEAIGIASAAALSTEDVILPQYREPGVLLWRGFTIQDFANQLYGNNGDSGKGRQMPMHYGSNKLNYFTVSSTIATQLPQAAGVAYSLKMEKKDTCVATYIGDGGTSEGDFHAALNFAAVMEAPVVFICRNNGWAISTHVTEQFRSDGVVVKGHAYGIQAIRVDGNDALAVYSAIQAAREIAITEHRPILVEALTYRVGHHSTSDDSTKYRSLDEIQYWKNSRNPVDRFRKWIERNGWWIEKEELELRSNTRKQVLQALQVAEKTDMPQLKHLFADVYDVQPPNLVEQEKQLRETVNRHPQGYPSNVPV
ncbi:hypothetical protein K2173_023010 [Erythroxylum novogranatense]|uniref:3-methyl-2-oxobutanoate dehydrogenase (2-methylpropanoyl-transferring) n=1 Tax=Erythroxylum novogranatense TaxID=1862640 RepID=A0AAV8T7W4_9ROSI|nr:hypothetical protein K2173_023010 [Erythroxylum novogranatense]